MALKPVVLVMTRAGEPTARKVARLLDTQIHGRAGRVDEADSYFENALDHVRDLFAAGIPIVGICASGILIRAVAPLLTNKKIEPPVVSVSDDGKMAIPLLGGHRGANRLAKEIAQHLDGIPAITTAGDLALGMALDEPPAGWRLANPDDAQSAMATLLGGAGAQVVGDEKDQAQWLGTVPRGEGLKISCTMKPVASAESDLHFAPQRVALGVGCARNCAADELMNLVSDALASAEISESALHSINTIGLKADEPAILALSQQFDVPIRLFDAETLEAETPRLENPSEVVFAEVGCHGVSEAAALAQVGEKGRLLHPKVKSANATCALAINDDVLVDFRGKQRGRLSIVGIGPGQSTWRTPEVSQLVSQADELVGYGLYIDLLGSLAVGKTRSDFPLGGEEARCRYALERAGEGHNVALVCSGDAGIYAMGALVFELLDRGEGAKGVSDAAKRAEIICSPGVSALQGAAARAGAPLGHDFCAISLSDLLTPRDDIIRRLKAAAEGDFVIAFYNPVSKTRRTLLAQARDILLEHRPRDTPVMLASNLGRPQEHIRYRNLSDLNVDEVDMLTVVLVGSSNSRLAALGEGPRMFTPRGYARRIDGDLSQ